MGILQTNIFQSLSLKKKEKIQLIDVFDVPGEKTITLQSHSSFIYLVVFSSPDVHVRIVTKGPKCGCRVFGLAISDASHPVTGSFKISLEHSFVSAEVEIISFLFDGAKFAIDGSLNILPHLDNVYGSLLKKNIILGKNISLTTLPGLTVASQNVRASHGANIDMLDSQKLFYMMSRGLTKQESQRLLIGGYVEYVLGHFGKIREKEKQYISTILYHI